MICLCKVSLCVDITTYSDQRSVYLCIACGGIRYEEHE